MKGVKVELKKLVVLEKRRIERRTSSMLKKRYTTKPYPLDIKALTILIIKPIYLWDSPRDIGQQLEG